MKLNLGCASRLLEGYVNIDIDDLDTIRRRYPHLEIEMKGEFLQANMFDLPFDKSSIDEIRADAFLEHLSFNEEKLFFYEISRLLKPNGLFEFSVPDFEDTVKSWLAAQDNWLDFFRDDDEAIEAEHWFGNYSYTLDNRWGYLTASIFGPQNGNGQFHKNAYTEGKIRAIASKLGFMVIEIDRFRWKDDREIMLRTILSKKIV